MRAAPHGARGGNEASRLVQSWGLFHWTKSIRGRIRCRKRSTTCRTARTPAARRLRTRSSSGARPAPKMVDLKFIDLLGTWQHFSLPLSALDEDAFEDGLGFDGSSIRGWQGINASRHAPDPGRRDGDDRPVHRGADAVAHLRRPRPDHPASRTTATRAASRSKRRGLPQVDRHRRHRVLRPRGGVLRLRRRPLRADREHAPTTRSTRARATGTRATPRPNLGYKIREKEGYFPVPPHDTLQRPAHRDGAHARARSASPVEFHHHEVATARPVRDRHALRSR